MKDENKAACCIETGGLSLEKVWYRNESPAASFEHHRSFRLVYFERLVNLKSFGLNSDRKWTFDYLALNQFIGIYQAFLRFLTDWHSRMEV